MLNVNIQCYKYYILTLTQSESKKKGLGKSFSQLFFNINI